MIFAIDMLSDPCDQIEHWQAAIIRNNENETTAPACWIRVGSHIEVIYWLNGMSFKTVIKNHHEK